MKYLVTGVMEIEVQAIVEAESEKEAMQTASSYELSLCVSCSEPTEDSGYFQAKEFSNMPKISNVEAWDES